MAIRTVNVSVVGEIVRKDNKNAGVQGEANVTAIHITLDKSWEGFGKRIIWRDATGENPVAIVLHKPIEELLEGEEAAEPLTFDTTIPAEPLALPGWCSFTIEGYNADDPGKVAYTVSDCLCVQPNTAYNTPAEPTPGQALQLQEEIEKIVPGVTAVVGEAVVALERAEEAVKLWEAWDYNTSYVPLNKVSRLGSSYICVNPCQGVDPAADADGLCWLLIASKGGQGPQGAEGPQGRTGGSGPTGSTGPQGEPGKRGETGGQGARGGQGTRGEQGRDGPTGPAGPQGIGVQGPAGQTGPQGADGPVGTIGPQGADGPRGINGVAMAATGLWAFNVDESGNLILVYTGDEQPDAHIDESGHLILSF